MFGCFPKPSKSYLIVKENHYNKAVDVFMGSKKKVTSEGKRHLGALIDSEAFKVSYAKSLVDDWIKQLKLLSIIAESEPQSAYSAFVGGFERKLTYFMRTIPSLGELLKPLEDVIRFNFISEITGGHLCSDTGIDDHILISLPVRFGGAAIPLFHNDAKYEHEKPRKLTSSLIQSIKNQYQIYSVNEKEQKSIKLNTT